MFEAGEPMKSCSEFSQLSSPLLKKKKSYDCRGKWVDVFFLCQFLMLACLRDFDVIDG